MTENQISNNSIEVSKINVVIAYHSGYGHTKNQAYAVAKGVETNAMAILLDVSTIENHDSEAWAILAKADAIIFGSPTYMGSVSAQFKKFADLSSKVWAKQEWKDKITGGFTNSASMNGDKFSTIQYLWTLAMQHSMLWVGTGLQASNKKDAKRDDINYLGGYSGLLATSPSDSSAQEAPTQGDLDTAILYGKRIVSIVQKFKK